MKPRFFNHCLICLVVVVSFSLFSLTSCAQSQSNQSEFYNAGNADLSVTGAQFDQYWVFRFDTSSSSHILALPSAADIVGNLSSPFVGEVINIAVAADGNFGVTLVPGTNTIVKPSAIMVSGNITQNMYCEIDSITSGSEQVTVY